MIRLQYTSKFSDDASIIYLMSVRMLSGLFVLFLVDVKGRRPLFLISFAGSALMMMLMGVVVAFDKSAGDSWIMLIAQLGMEVAGGLGVVTIADIYTAEAFNTMKKASSILYTTTAEFLFHVIIIAVTFDVISTTVYNWIFLVGSGILVLIITVFLHKELPETAKMSIRQTRNEFLKSGEIVFSGSKMPVQNITFN